MNKARNIIMEGLVLEALSNANFKVQLDNGLEIICYASGKMRMNYIKILPGDRVGIELSPYDPSKGRIYKRF